ncbi:MAG TPA: ABC transporter substrate-binding protein [Verrucomicrobiota bacterium]|nr:ABC transporter substrate-binding protein [Verrucomicrobiota bacterium]
MPSRRRIHWRWVPLGASVVLLCIGLLATKSLAAAETPRRPNVLRLARIIDPSTLDPALIQLQEDIMLFPLLHLPLLDVTNGTQLMPCAAKVWSCSADQRVFTLELRPGVTFSNGREVVADDYVYALERILNPATAAMFSGYLQGIRGAQAFVAGETNHVVGLRASSPDTLVVELERSDPTFPFLLANVPGAAVPREEVERLGRNFSVQPVGAGPYRVQSWVRGARLQLSRNPHYHGPVPQHFEGVDLLIGGDETTHLMMFERGELDIANINLIGIPLPSFRRLTGDPRWHGLIERETLFQTDYVALNTEIPPLDNLKVRRAINHAIDRDRRMRVDQGYFTHAEGAIPPIMPGFNSQLRGYDYNPTKARELLRDSGLPLPLRTTMWHGTEERVRVLAQGIQWDLHQVGIEVALKPVATAELFTSAQKRGLVPMTLSGWFVGIPDPVDMLGALFDGRAVTSAATMNLAFYNNPEVNRLLDQAASEVNLSQRFARYQHAEELIVRDAPWAFLGHQSLYALRQPWLKGPLMEPIWVYRFDRVWIEN